MNLFQLFCLHKYQRFSVVKSTEQTHKLSGVFVSETKKTLLIAVCETCGKRQKVLL